MGVYPVRRTALLHAAFRLNQIGKIREIRFRGLTHLDVTMHPSPTCCQLGENSFSVPGILQVDLFFEQWKESAGVAHHPYRLHGSPVHKLCKG